HNRKEFDKGYLKVDVPSNLRKTASGELETVPEETEISEEQMRKRRNLTGFWSKFKDRIIDLFKEEEDRHL
ncbi:MAG: cell division protein FtsA, partial [Chitinophagaceae bacterium]